MQYRGKTRGDFFIMEQKQTKAIEEITHFFLIQKTEESLKESTLSRYSFLCEKYIIPYFKNIAPDDFSNESIRNFIRYLKTEGLKGKPLAPKTINDIITLLIQIIKGYCKFEIDVKKPTYAQSEITVFTKKEYNKLKSHLAIGTDNKKLGIMIAMLTGIRIGELCALQWENIDLQSGVININKTIQRVQIKDITAKTKIIIDVPKSPASIRTIPLPEILLNKLNEFKSNSSTYILTNTKKYIEPRVYQRHFKSHLEACNIKDNNFHTIRHTFATRAIVKGIDIKSLSAILGHTDVSFTMKTYVHPSLEHKRVQIEKIADDFDDGD